MSDTTSPNTTCPKTTCIYCLDARQALKDETAAARADGGETGEDSFRPHPDNKAYDIEGYLCFDCYEKAHPEQTQTPDTESK
jgi:hypothetical protein